MIEYIHQLTIVKILSLIQTHRADKVSEEVRKKQRELLQETELQRYAIAGTDQEWAAAIDAKSARGAVKSSLYTDKKDSNKDIPWDAKKKEKSDKDGDDKDKKRG